jgi:N-acetylglucosamine-6-phosphate deacetylase
MSRVALAGAAILQAGKWVHGRAVVLEGGTISAVVPQDDLAKCDRVNLPPGSLLAPGLIDIQVNGGGGILFNDDPSAEAACEIARAHRKLGTTGILPTLITDTRRKFAQAAAAAVPGPGILGIHFEGPFLAVSRRGVHPPEHIRAPEEADIASLEALASRLPGKVLLTVAPESVDDHVLRRLSAASIKLSAGHSAASFERVAEAVAAGVTGFTHLFNAMAPLAARAPGIAAAALLQPDSWCGVIADGFHVHQAMLRLLLASRPASRIILVSDAMPPTGTGAQEFELQGRIIFRRGGRLVTEDGTLAGADLCLAEAVRRAVGLFGITPATALGMASAAPAAFLGIDHIRGHIAPGFAADLVLLTENLDVLGTWLAGAWQGEEVFG